LKGEVKTNVVPVEREGSKEPKAKKRGGSELAPAEKPRGERELRLLQIVLPG